VQYILTQEELDARVPRKELEETQKEIQQVAGLLEKQVGCWRLTASRHGYCDDCPLGKLRRICTKSREWSK